jgi:ribosomal 50S subunit-recycling heat shock protein
MAIDPWDRPVVVTTTSLERRNIMKFSTIATFVAGGVAAFAVYKGRQYAREHLSHVLNENGTCVHCGAQFDTKNRIAVSASKRPCHVRVSAEIDKIKAERAAAKAEAAQKKAAPVAEPSTPDNNIPA